MERTDIQHLDIPDEPGIYLFRDSRRRILYVGKATSLRDRVRSYFAADITTARGARIAGMVEQAKNLTWETTDSVLEALILEANLIKKHQPPFNVRDKDNKSFNYLVITKEAFPRVLVVRGRELFQSWNSGDIRYLFGPFPQGGTLKEALMLVRKIFPFRDTCVPAGEVGKPCFNRQLGRCPGVCTGEVTQRDYARTIRHIALLFSGRKRRLLEKLERDMKLYAKQEQFEKAETTRRQIAALTHIRDVSLIKHDARESSGGSVRIEAFDIAHTGGSDTVGVMAVVRDGLAAPSELRRFRVRGVKNNDTAAIAEVISRRLGHPEWQLPRIMVIDGGQAQLNAAARVLREAGVGIPLVGVVKDEKHRPKRVIGDANLIREHERDILQANREAHERAVRYHRSAMRKRMI